MKEKEASLDWIRVAKELPNFYLDVVVYCKDGFMSPAYANEEDGHFAGFKVCSHDDYHLRNVTHWIALPDPPIR